MARARIILDFPANTTEKPFTYHLVKDFDLSVNILRAKIEPDKAGRLLMEVEASQESIQSALGYLAEQGVGVRFLKGEITIDDGTCIHCGACTAVCNSGALTMSAPDWDLVFQPERCVACDLCVKACPLGIISVNF